MIALRFLRTLTPTAWITIGVLAAFLLFGGYCAHKAAQGRQEARAGQTLADGRTAAAGDASAVRDRADDRNDQISDAVKKGTDDVRQAPDRSSANLAARRGVCRVNPSAGPDCRMLLADPSQVD